MSDIGEFSGAYLSRLPELNGNATAPIGAVALGGYIYSQLAQSVTGGEVEPVYEKALQAAPRIMTALELARLTGIENPVQAMQTVLDDAEQQRDLRDSISEESIIAAFASPEFHRVIRIQQLRKFALVGAIDVEQLQRGEVVTFEYRSKKKPSRDVTLLEVSRAEDGKRYIDGGMHVHNIIGPAIGLKHWYGLSNALVNDGIYFIGHSYSGIHYQSYRQNTSLSWVPRYFPIRNGNNETISYTHNSDDLLTDSRSILTQIYYGRGNQFPLFTHEQK